MNNNGLYNPYNGYQDDDEDDAYDTFNAYGGGYHPNGTTHHHAANDYYDQEDLSPTLLQDATRTNGDFLASGHESHELDHDEEDDDDDDDDVDHDDEEEDLNSVREFQVGDEWGRTGDGVLDAKPRILLMGPQRSGKTSIQQVVFRQMSPHETMFAIQNTQQIEVHDIQHSAFLNCTVWDYPGGVYGRDVEEAASTTTTTLDYSQPPSAGVGGGGIGAAMMMRQPPVYEHSSVYEYSSSSTSTTPFAHHQQQQHPSHHSLHPQQQQQQHPSYPLAHQQGSYPTTTNHNNTMTPSPHSPPTLNHQSQFHTSTTLDTSAPNQHLNHNHTNHHHHHQDETYTRASAVVFVLDANDEPYADSIQGLMQVVKRAMRVNPSIHIEVFLHRIDGEIFVTEETRYDALRDVRQQVSDELYDSQLEAVNISYHLTSIFDHSIREAFSKVVQKLVPHQETLGEMLHSFCTTTQMEKALLFDVQSKLYLGTDHNNPDPPMTELSAEMIEVAIDVSGIYDPEQEDEEQRGHDNEDGTATDQENPANGEDTEEEQGSSLASTLEGDPIEGDIPGSVHHDVLLGTMVGSMSKNEMALAEDGKQDDLDDEDDIGGEEVCDNGSCLIKLQNGQAQSLYLKEVDPMLALICWGSGENFRRRNLIDYNIGILQKAVRVLKGNPDRASP